MNLDEWQKNWNELGKDDPLWVVLTDPTRKGGKWDPAEFFQTGRDEIAKILSEAAALGPPLAHGRALDFGCGVGRLSQAMAEHFEEVEGVDISPSMIAHAERFNRFPQTCRYHVNSDSDLRRFPDRHFDFIYSSITLQHIEPRFEKLYVQDFIRVLKPEGVAVFQILSPGLWRGMVPESLVAVARRVKHGGKAFIGMFGIRESVMNRLLRDANATVLRLDRHGSLWSRWRSLRYFVTRR